MARRGWVAAETGPDQWRRLMVFDDGWVELPGMGRTMSDARNQLRRSLFLLGGFALALALIYGLTRLLALIDDPPSWLPFIPGLLILAVIVAGSVAVTRMRWRRVQQARGDVVQARAERQSGRRLTRAEGAPMWRRADTAEQLAAWLDGETHVRATEVTQVSCERDGEDHVVSVRATTGGERRYRSPDAKLAELLAPFGGAARYPT